VSVWPRESGKTHGAIKSPYFWTRWGKTIVAGRVISKTVKVGKNERITDIELISPDFYASQGFAKEQLARP